MTSSDPFHPYDNLTDWADAQTLHRAALVTGWHTAADIRAYLAERLPETLATIDRPGDAYPCALGVAQAVIDELVGIIERQTADLDRQQRLMTEVAIPAAYQLGARNA